MFPERDRLSGYSVAFKVGLGILGGITPMIAASLIASTGVMTAAAVHLTVAALLAVFAFSSMPDRSREALRSTARSLRVAIWILGYSLCRQREDSKLLKHAEHIQHFPFLNDLSVFETT